MSVRNYLAGAGVPENSMPDLPKSIIGCLLRDDELVVSRAPDGTVLSRVRDCIWNMKPYCANSVTTWNFSNWSNTPGRLRTELIISEMQSIQMVRLHFHSSPRKVSSIGISGLRLLAKFAEKNSFSIEEVLTNPVYQMMLLSSLSSAKKSTVFQVAGLVSELYYIRVSHPLFILAPVDYKFVEAVGNVAGAYGEYRKSIEQTKLIPSRIYASIVAGFDEELLFFNAHADGLEQFFAKRSVDKHYGAGRKSRTVPWLDAIRECSIEELCVRYSVTNILNLGAYLNSVQAIAKNWIHLFTGMRASEVRTLPSDALGSMRVGNEVVTVLEGFTSKTAGENHVSTYWLSSPIIERAITASLSIGRMAALKHGWDNSNPSAYPLFPMLGNVQKTSCSFLYASAPVAGIVLLERQTNLISRISGAHIIEADIVELERFDGFKDWRSDPDFAVGKPWPLATHQFRRSLAVYSARSGMVSLGSLANQFKHLTETMTSYYRSDQIFAVNFLASEDQQAMTREFEYERRVAGLINYESDVINSSGRLWGGEGNRIQVSRDRGKPLIITTDRETTARKFEKGEMVYKESPLGGCTNLNACDRIGTISVFACLDCQYAVLDSNKSIRKIRYGISRLQKSRGMFPPTSPFHLQINKEIDTIYQQVERAGFGHEIEDLK
ncbi:hypothetical protein IAE39_000644 [Pseudomonas sp. S37]|uniref:hypothetical protein n=1 Tax=Pseudomonas sp. S37 TaxID=2767449 RepID=UPI0019132885|nr:hypothetical protein [Pseudomonas sp. S37]MBK4992470.1 hypothetical protein [Pseudomonas sp. S37]